MSTPSSPSSSVLPSEDGAEEAARELRREGDEERASLKRPVAPPRSTKGNRRIPTSWFENEKRMGGRIGSGAQRWQRGRIQAHPCRGTRMTSTDIVSPL
jgi:hypothetical protein